MIPALRARYDYYLQPTATQEAVYDYNEKIAFTYSPQFYKSELNRTLSFQLDKAKVDFVNEDYGGNHSSLCGHRYNSNGYIDTFNLESAISSAAAVGRYIDIFA